MVDRDYLLNSKQMAEFVARGLLTFDRIVPNDINKAVIAEIDRRTATSGLMSP